MPSLLELGYLEFTLTPNNLCTAFELSSAVLRGENSYGRHFISLQRHISNNLCAEILRLSLPHYIMAYPEKSRITHQQALKLLLNLLESSLEAPCCTALYLNSARMIENYV